MPQGHSRKFSRPAPHPASRPSAPGSASLGQFPVPRPFHLAPPLPPGPAPSAWPRPRLPLGLRRTAAGGRAAGPRVRSPARRAHAPWPRARSRERMAGAAPSAIMDEEYFVSAAERGDEADGGQVRGHRAARPRRVGPAVTLWCKHSAPPCPPPPTPAGGARPLRPARPPGPRTRRVGSAPALAARRAGARAAPAVTRGDPRSLPPLPLYQTAGPQHGPMGRRSGGWSGSAPSSSLSRGSFEARVGQGLASPHRCAGRGRRGMAARAAPH